MDNVTKYSELIKRKLQLWKDHQKTGKIVIEINLTNGNIGGEPMISEKTGLEK